MKWQNLTEFASLKPLLEKGESFAIFKHSTRCSISSMVKDRMERQWPDSGFPVFYVDLLANRGLSNAIADHFGIEHESPQLLVIHNGEVTYSASHHAIDPRTAATSAN